ncbi:P-loop containing nucleoside triphosphate hydrolase protein [Mycena galericulata]|nr:P-loop containing nucleoside triphosphate hydrolase protein [Mycena galericulata]
MSDAFTWSSPEGFELARRIIRSTPVPYVPHDHQLEGVCKSLDGISLFAITPTGSGKTSYYILYILIVLAVVNDPTLCPSAAFPQNPCLMVICPTIPLQIEMQLGLKALAINSHTRCEANRHQNQDLWTVARTEPNVILTPEQLKSAEYEKALRDDVFQDRMCGTGFDEVHLLNTWGVSFRKDFLQMGFVHARMTGSHNPWILTSATVRDGAPFDNICKLLGLNDSNFHLIRRSSARPDVQILFRDLVSPISGDSFPELDWMLTSGRPSIIYAPDYGLGSRVYAYLCGISKSNNPNQIRMYNSLNFESHNAETRELLTVAPGEADSCQIVIGTDSLSVGVGMPARLDCVILYGDARHVKDADDFFQKLGRVGRTKGGSQRAHGIIYLARQTLDNYAAGILKDGENPPDLSMPTLIVALCKVAAQNKLYKNPPFDPPCTCPTCAANPPDGPRIPCDCSGCLPENIVPPQRPKRISRVNTNIKKSKRLSKIQKSHGVERLIQLRLEIWRNSDQTKLWMYPPTVFLSDILIASILDNFVLLDTLERVAAFVSHNPYLAGHAGRIFQVLQDELKPQLVAIAAARKAENKAARSKTAD